MHRFNESVKHFDALRSLEASVELGLLRMTDLANLRVHCLATLDEDCGVFLNLLLEFKVVVLNRNIARKPFFDIAVVLVCKCKLDLDHVVVDSEGFHCLFDPAE